MIPFRLTGAAEADLEEIGRYTRRRWGRAQQRAYLAAIDRRIRWLAEDPSRGRPRDDIRPGYRDCAEGSHLIFYRLRGGRTEIIGILHQAMDAAARLGGD